MAYLVPYYLAYVVPYYLAYVVPYYLVQNQITFWHCLPS